jgi:hypothetical protein
MKANNLNVPTIFVTERPADFTDGKKHFGLFLTRLNNDHRAMCKLVKLLGKWFIWNPKTEEERLDFYKRNTGIVDDVRGEQDALDFAAKLKSVIERHEGYQSQHYYCFPNYGKGEVGYLFMGHHNLHDGRTQMQTLYNLSDDPHNAEYPFLTLRSPGFFFWLMASITFPVKFFQAIRYYRREAHDKNVVNKHPLYMTGEARARNAITMDTSKVKAFAKKHGATVNDLILALGSMTFQKYFYAKGEESKQTTWMIPFSFKTIPKSPKDY